MPIIRISGLPSEENVGKQIRILRLYIRKAGITRFWINIRSDTFEDNLKEADIDLPSEVDAYNLEEYISQVAYKRGGIPFYLKSQMQQYSDDNRSRSPQSSSKRPRYENDDRYSDRYSPGLSYDRERSQSPLYYEDTSKLDIEIEILKKKRMVVEEQQRLLEEKEKLQRMKENNARASRKEYKTIAPKKYSASALKEHGKPESRDRQPRPAKDERSQALWVPPKRLDGIPMFIFPCKNLMKKIRPIIGKKTRVRQEKAMLEKLIRVHLRKTIAIALEGRKERMSAVEIVELYRQLHPVTEDEELVTKTLADIRASYWPIENDVSAKRPQRKKEGPRSSTSDVAVNKQPANATQKDVEKPLIIKEEISNDSTDKLDEIDKVRVKLEIKTEDVVDGIKTQTVETETSNESSLIIPSRSDETRPIEYAAKNDKPANDQNESTNTPDDVANVADETKTNDVLNVITGENKLIDVAPITVADKNKPPIDVVPNAMTDETKSTDVAVSNSVSEVEPTNDAINKQLNFAYDVDISDADWVTNVVDWNDDEDSKDEQ